jgi:N-acetyl sugar amidotransferase
VQPNTRPSIYFSDDGVCGACLWEEKKNTIDWKERKNELFEIAEKVKRGNTSAYDCAIGVSGGKDSTFQALYSRDVLGLRTLLVNCEPFRITKIGAYNIENLKRKGFDVISIRPNEIVLKKLMINDFYKCLNVQKATEYTLWASTYIIAEKFNIPLIIQGENPAQTLGTTDLNQDSDDALNANTQNTISNDRYEEYLFGDIKEPDLFLYGYSQQCLRSKGIRGIWLSSYIREWGQNYNALFSIKQGMRVRSRNNDPYKSGIYRLYYQLDSGGILDVNQMFKYIKFGFGQATDHVCYDIRDNLITRDEGISIIKEIDGRCEKKHIDEFCNFIGISEREMWSHANKFRGDMWKETERGYELKNPIWKQEDIEENCDINRIIERLNKNMGGK